MSSPCSFSAHVRAVAENRLGGKEVHTLVADHRWHGEQSGKWDVYQWDNYAIGVGNTALQAVLRSRCAEERDVVGRGHPHFHIGVNRVERGAVVTWMPPNCHRDMIVRK